MLQKYFSSLKSSTISKFILVMLTTKVVSFFRRFSHSPILILVRFSNIFFIYLLHIPEKVIDNLVQSSSPQPVPEGNKSLNNHYRNSPSNATNMTRSSYDSSSNSFKQTSSKRNYFDRSHSPAVYAVR